MDPSKGERGYKICNVQVKQIIKSQQLIVLYLLQIEKTINNQYLFYIITFSKPFKRVFLKSYKKSQNLNFHINQKVI